MKIKNIKPLTKKNIFRLVEIWNQNYKVLTSSGKILSFQDALKGFDNKFFDEYIGIFVNSILIGFALIKKTQKISLIKHIAIDNKFRNKGLGKKLLQFVIINAKKANKKVQVEVLKSNSSALYFFTSAGFKVFKEHKDEYILEIK